MKEQFLSSYKEKLYSPEDAINCINRDARLITVGCYNPPSRLIEALTKKAADNYFKQMTDVYIFRCPDHVFEFFNNPKALKTLNLIMPFMGKSIKAAVDQMKGIEGICPPSFLPTHYSTMEQAIANRADVPDVHLIQVSPMDEYGYFSTGVDGSFSIPEAHRAKKLIVEVNPQMPRTFGENLLHIRNVDAVIENESTLSLLPVAPITKLDKKIAAIIGEHLNDGDCVQLGVGGVPNAIGEMLTDYNDLGVHTEMLCDSIVHLIHKGNVTNKYKNIHCYTSVFNVAMLGDTELYQYMHNNPSLRCYRASYVNNPYVIGKNDNVKSINSFVEIDLYGQVAAESIHYSQISGTGGQVDFIRGAQISKNGKSFLAAHSTTKNGTISKIVPRLNNFVTTARTDVQYVVTEYGAVNLVGLSCRERAAALIELAHPDFRVDLRKAAHEMRIM